jgi:predicted esterase
MSWKQFGPIVLCLVLSAAACGAEDEPTAESLHKIFTDVPAQIDPDARYLFYLHGAIIERAGVRPTHPKFGVYEYQKIVEAFAERGFVVISEARPEGTDGMFYAATVADQVRALINGGVPPEHITVVGFSKGGGIAIAASSMLANDDVNFVFMAACNPWLDSHPEIVGRGRMLSLRESSDELAGSCESFFGRSPSPHDHRELLLELGGGHGAFYRPRPEWIDPVVEWAMASGS